MFAVKRIEAPSYPVSIFIAGDPDKARRACRHWCDDQGACVTVTPTTYAYTGGEEVGVIVGFINYPRFPASPQDIERRAFDLGLWLKGALDQQSFSIQTPRRTEWFSWRPEDAA